MPPVIPRFDILANLGFTVRFLDVRELELVLWVVSDLKGDKLL
jgi:hypothetical protein